MVVRRVVVVGRKDEYTEPLRTALASDAWEIRGCPGPSGNNCPLLSGQDCELRDWAGAAIVFLDPRKGPAANVVTARCAAGSPAVVLLEGQVDPPRQNGEFIVMGALRSASRVVESLRELTAGSLDQPEQQDRMTRKQVRDPQEA